MASRQPPMWNQSQCRVKGGPSTKDSMQSGGWYLQRAGDNEVWAGIIAREKNAGVWQYALANPAALREATPSASAPEKDYELE